ncbi:MAG TPA: helix-turn-helix transcriptional regulator [Oleiagrimonas sp.]|nr:helix-turn-helix transcriptional regulator [Oleiagrimonas sp.]
MATPSLNLDNRKDASESGGLPGNVSATPAARATVDEGFMARIRVLIKTYGGVSHIAQVCGFSEGVVRSWRDGRSDPSRTRCLALAHGLNVSLLWLMTGNGPMLDEPDRHRHGETTFVMDVHRLSAAMQVLQATLESTGNYLPMESHAQLLSEYYVALSDPDPLRRAEGVGAIHQHLLECIRQANAQAQDLAIKATLGNMIL